MNRSWRWIRDHGFGFFVGASIGWDVVDVVAGSVLTFVASVGALEDVFGTTGATKAGEFGGMGGKFMGVLTVLKNPRAPTTIA